MCIFSLQLDFISPFLQYVFGVFFFFFPSPSGSKNQTFVHLVCAFIPCQKLTRELINSSTLFSAPNTHLAGQEGSCVQGAPLQDSCRPGAGASCRQGADPSR